MPDSRSKPRLWDLSDRPRDVTIPIVTADRSGKRPRYEGRPAASGAPSDSGEFAAGVGERIRQCRQELGWTQAELAASADISPNYVARLERGELGPSLFVASQIAAALGVPLETLTTPQTAARRTTTRRKGA